ncbi:hypothetical protein [Methylobacterium sp. C1]|uniref:hypothetical protein n=1 Tax=Methylobacterium sp. C1 TaxID=1479019 RepID=UPI0008D9E614|nr:hypothetical protein [Methylobacterium sp. C1]
MSAATRLTRVDGVTPERAAQQLYAAGHRTLSAGMPDRQLSVLITRAFRGTDVRYGDGLNSSAAMQAVRYHLQRICAAAIAAPYDPEHIEAVNAETAHFARQAGGRRQ